MVANLSWVVPLAFVGCGRLGFDDGDAAMVATDAYASAVAQDHPLAYWRFEDSGGTAIDQIGNAHPGTFEGAVARTPGLAGTGAVFDGSSTRLVIGDAFSFPDRAAYSIELWVDPINVDTQVRRIVERMTTAGPGDGYGVYFSSGFTLQERMHAGVEGGYGSGPGLIGNRFTYVVATYDGTEAAFYLDGAYQGGMLDTNRLVSGAGALVIGDSAAGLFFKFWGVLDEVAIYGSALTPAQITAHLHAAGR